MLFNLGSSNYDPASPVAILGLDLAGDDTTEFIPNLDAAIREGFPAAALRALQSHGLALPAVAVGTGLAERTLKRRLSSKRLDPIESDRVLRLASVAGTIMDELNLTLKECVQWLTEPIDPHAPDHGLASTRLSLCATEAGIVQLAQILEDDRTLRKAAALRREQDRRSGLNAVARRSRVRPARQNDTPAKGRAKPKDRQTNFVATVDGIDETSFTASTMRLIAVAPAPIREITRFTRNDLPALTRDIAWDAALEAREIFDAPAAGSLHVALGAAYARQAWLFSMPKFLAGRMSRSERHDLYKRVGHAIPATYAIAGLFAVSLFAK